MSSVPRDLANVVAARTVADSVQEAPRATYEQWVSGGRTAIGLVPAHPQRHRHPANDMTAEVHFGDGAFSSIVNPTHDGGVEWTLRYGDVEDVRFAAASLVSSYDYLLSDYVTASEAIRRLRILRNARRGLLTPDGALASTSRPGKGEDQTRARDNAPNASGEGGGS